MIIVLFQFGSTGVYTDTLTSINGCVSIVTDNLTIQQDSTSLLSPTICQGSSFTVGDSTYNADRTYTNVFTASNGCDSIVTTNLTVLDSSGIEDALLNQVSIYPNPATDQISLIVPEKLIGKSYQILDYSGSRILTEINSMIDISSIAKGVYIIQIGEQKLSLKMIKQ